MLLEHKARYLQIAFNYDLRQAKAILPYIPRSPRIIIEAGTPFIKREGMNGIRQLSWYWNGLILADLKTSDGALEEVYMAYDAGASGASVLGSAPHETLNLFIQRCQQLKMISMIDMLGVDDPLKCILKLSSPPDVVILHKGRDEENTRGKLINYRHVTRIRSKYDVLIAAAGGIDLDQARSAIFNGANIVVANVVNPDDPWSGIDSAGDVGKIAQEFLRTIE
ncbi:MAG: orotidine 5'-phosphate decarboxylase / HUMPS family protein [Candidatus Margulisiibacteriota bacterium]|jgi:3-keto-L-gulonate-6-phosphate decarboxylase